MLGKQERKEDFRREKAESTDEGDGSVLNNERHGDQTMDGWYGEVPSKSTEY